MKLGQRFRCVKCQAIVTVGQVTPARPSAGPTPGSVGPAPAQASQGPRKAPAAPGQAGPPPAPGQAQRVTAAQVARPAQAAPSNQSLFQVASGLDDDINLLDESGSTEDLASALLESASKMQAMNAAQQPAAPEAPAPPPGTPPPASLQIPGFKVGEAIAKGGMATVYKGLQVSLNRPVAIKVLDPDLAQNPEGVARFRKEAAVLSALSHNSIVGVIDAGQQAGNVYLIMEYVPGTNLRYLLENVRVPMDKLVGYVEQVLEALDYAHQKGIVHRDVKPENIIISRDQQVKLADFGIAGLTADAFGIDMAGLTRGLTKTSIALGTQHYMAPEQMKDARKVGPQADLFSTGVVLYEILTGDVPVGAFDMPSVRNPNVPASFDGIVIRALKSNPADRFASAGEMLRELRGVLAEARGEAPPPATAPAAAAAGGLAGLVGGVAGPSPEAIAAAMAAASRPPPPSSGPPGRSGAIDPEAAAALAKLKRQQEEEANWKAWQAGQEQATEFRAGSEKRERKASASRSPAASGGGDLREQVQRERARQAKHGEDEFKAKWEAKLAAQKPNPWARYARQIPGVLGAMLGILVLLSLFGAHRTAPIVRSIGPAVALGDMVRKLARLDP